MGRDLSCPVKGQDIVPRHSKCLGTSPIEMQKPRRSQNTLKLKILALLGCLAVLGLLFIMGLTRTRLIPESDVDTLLNSQHSMSAIFPFLALTPKDDCCNGSSGINLQIFCERSGEPAKACNCGNYEHCRLALLTAFTSGHLKETHDMVPSLQKFLPKARVIVYNLGLDGSQCSDALQSYVIYTNSSCVCC